MNEDNQVVKIAKIETSLEHMRCDHNEFRNQICGEMKQFREQTDKWMHVMGNKLPPWAVMIGAGMSGTIGSMATWIFNHLTK